MGRCVHVFAGLGSDVLFSDATRDQATRDSRLPEGQILTTACHRIFVDEVSRASTESELCLRVDLDDFTSSADLIRPSKRYHKHPIVQNAVLCLVQLLRHQGRRSCSSNDLRQDDAAVSGFCVGLFAAVAVATSKSALQFLSRAEECFRIAVMVGIASYRAARKVAILDSDEPWSVVVNRIEEAEMTSLISQHESKMESHGRVRVSSLNSPTCVTISGQGRHLREFIETVLPSRCTTKPTNILSPYHEETLLKDHKASILEQVSIRKLSFPSIEDLFVPLIANSDGSLIQPKTQSTSDDLLSHVLEMTLTKPTNWVAVQNTIVALAEDATDAEDPALTVYNYGPGYGALNHRNDLASKISVCDVSVESKATVQGHDDIAIVGVGVDLPDAPDLQTLWQNLIGGVTSCSEIPADRFHLEDYYREDGCKPVNESRSLGTKYGNFLEDPFLFDNQLFGISPREASSIDPQQRIMLQTVYRSLESAGYIADSTPSFSRETFGCFIGNATLDYTDNLRNNIDVYYSPGTLRAFISGRISYAFKWSGPCATIDTACSSSLVAIYQAARAIAAGDCRAAVAGGVNVITSPDMHIGLDKAHFLSPTGQCKAFDEAADGYCRSDGCAAFVLKKLPDALAENDRILGVIKGVALNQCGETSSITHPHSPTQERLFQKLLAQTGIHPHDISVAEAHGTGTQAGDPNELRSIRGAFSKDRSVQNPLYVGSIKSNIGHCEAASGGAALAKLLLMLKHKRIPPQALLQTLNPAIDDLEVDGTFIATEACDWTPLQGRKRTALLNNFGAAGSNAALILQEHCNEKVLPDVAKKPMSYVFGCSARNPELLEQTRSSLLAWLKTLKDDLTLADICYTSTARKSLRRYRIAITASSLEELIPSLEHAKPIEAPDSPHPIVFLFSGQGSQYLSMGRDLMELSPVFRKTVHHCHQLLSEWGFSSCLEVIQPESEDKEQMKQPRILEALQVAVFVIEVGIAQMLIAAGILPSMVTGHSLGEYAALVIAGVLDLDSGLWLVAQRAHLIISNCDLWQSCMLAVNMPSDEVRHDLLSQAEFEGLEISCENSPSDCVVGGNVEVLKKLKEHISGQKKRSALLDVPVAYHTKALEPVLENLKEAVSRLSLRPPTIPVASNVLGRVVQPGEDVFSPDYFAKHCRGVVAFDGGVTDILQQDEDFSCGRWIEIGPHPMLLPMIAPRMPNSGALKLPTLRKDKPADKTLSDLYCALYQNDLGEVDWRAWFEGLPSKPSMIDFPPEPMAGKSFCVPLPRETPLQSSNEECANSETTPFTLLQRSIGSDEHAAAVVFETPIQGLAALIKGHMVCGKALCPASVYTEMALAAVTCAEGSNAEHLTFKLSEISFERPLLYAEGSSETVRIVLEQPAEAGDRGFEVLSFVGSGGASQAKRHCTGKIKPQPFSKANSKLRGMERGLARRKTSFQDGNHQTFSTGIMYKKIFSRVVEYSSHYQAVRKIYLDEAAEEMFASCELPPSSIEAHYAGQPVLIDTMLHVAGFAANLNVDNETVCICHHVHSTNIFRKVIAPNHKFDVHCSNFSSSEDSESIFADAHAVDEEGIIAVIKGMDFRRMKLSKIQTAFDLALKSAPRTGVERKSPSPPRVKQEVQRISDSAVGSPGSGNGEAPRKASTTASSDASQMVLSILSATTGIDSKDITPRTDLTSMGVDSMMIFELERKLEEVMREKPSVAEITACKTVQDMENLVSAGTSAAVSPSPKHNVRRQTPSKASPNGASRATSRNSHTSAPPSAEPTIPDDMMELLRSRLGRGEQPERIQRGNGDEGRCPVYLIHPGAGVCLHYRRMGALDRDLHTIQDTRIFASAEDDWRSVDEIAREYAALIRTHHGRNYDRKREIVVGGWSFGGVIAFEAARILLSEDSLSVRGTVLIDPPPPFDHIPIARETIERMMAATMQQQQHHKQKKMRPKSVADFEDAVASLTVRNNLRRAALLGHYAPVAASGPMPRVVLLRSAEGVRLPGIATESLPCNPWLHDRSDPRTCSEGWERLTGEQVQVLDIPGDHFTPFELDTVQGTTEAVRQACIILEG